MNLSELNRESLDLLNRITTVGAQNAALVLTKMIGIPVDVSFPDITVIKVEELLKSEENKNQLTGFVFCRFAGDVQGIAALMLPRQSVITVLESFYGRKIKSLNEMKEVDYSGVKEVGNILIASFLNALSNTYNITAMPTVPDVAVDFLPSILQEFSLMLLSEEKDNLVSFRTQLVNPKEDKAIFGSLLIFFEPEQTINAILGEEKK